jgi:CSLREA domain-containing protein
MSVVAVAVGSLLFVAAATANTITVNSTADTTGNGSICTLRAAILTANVNQVAPPTPVDGCAVPDSQGADTIIFSLGAGPHTIQLGSQLPPVVHTATITGPGAGLLTVQGEVDAAVSPEAYPIFETDSDASFGGAPASLTLEDMTITKGSRGVFENAGASITLNAVTVSGNTSVSTAVGSSGANGAGVESAFGGAVTINDSTISGNSATTTTTGPGGCCSVFTLANGGAISMSQGGALSINTSTISNNTTTAHGNQTAQASGAILDSGGNITVTRSTISGNTTSATVSEAGGAGSSRAAGGGIALSGGDNQLTLDRSTVSGNSAIATAAQGGDASATGGGIFVVWFFGSPPTASATGSTIANNAVSGAGSGSVLGSNVDTSIGASGFFTAKNTIFASGSGAVNCAQEGDGEFTSGGYNIDSGNTCLGSGTTGDQTDTAPNLGPLQDNGGVQGNGDPILTRAPALNSAAVDKGTNAGIGAANDQRGSGFPRTFNMTAANADDGTDVGAFEQSVSASPTSHGFGSLQWGTTSSTQAISMGNRTGNALPAGTVLGGTDAGDFQTSSDGCTNTTVPNNTGCTLDVAFHPVSAGDGLRNGSLSFSVSPVQLVTLTGTATGFIPAALDVAPASHDFGSTQVGTPTGATQFVVTNTGLGTSGTMATTLTGANASEFGITANTCAGQTLAGSATCTVSVRLAPTSAGAKAASLNITGTPGGTTSSALTGTATAPPPANATPGPTGQQAAALKKCKKKKSAQARKKCKKKAKALPV